MIYKRFAANLRAQNWFAIGIEFGIVVAGVFVGTQVSNWNAQRLEKRETRRMIAQLGPNLQVQIDYFSTARIIMRPPGATPRPPSPAGNATPR